jgi:hypothetical protein
MLNKNQELNSGPRFLAKLCGFLCLICLKEQVYSAMLNKNQEVKSGQVIGKPFWFKCDSFV